MPQNQDCLEALEKEPLYELDPERLFRMRFKRAVACGEILDNLAYKILPYNLLKSFTIVFDPTWKFRLSRVRISPVTRTRTMSKDHILKRRGHGSARHIRHTVKTLNCASCAQSQSDSPDDTYTNVQLAPDALKVVTIKDTTARTRKPGEDHGEFELFDFDMYSPPRSVSRTGLFYSVTICPEPLCAGKEETIRTEGSYSGWSVGSSAGYSASNVATLRAAAISELSGVMANKLPSLLSAALPSSRRMTLFRSAFELRELPRAVLQLKGSLIDLVRDLQSVPRNILEMIYSNKTIHNIPKEYVGYWFGWRQIQADLQNLLVKPAEVVKEINYLIARRGKPTTFRRSVKFPGAVTTAPAWVYNPASLNIQHASGETVLSTVHWHRKDHELRLVLNATFDFPTMGIPSLRKELFLEKMGVRPTASDLYNLIPWTWLFDWFSGVGNYVELIDTINRASDLYNWGFLTGITHGKVFAQHNTKTTSSQALYYPGSSEPYESSFDTNYIHTSVLEYKAHIRKNIVSAYGVKSTLDESTLSAYQKSIIGGILLSRL